MPDPNDPSHVVIVQQRGDNTVVVYVQTDSFNPGQEVEVSVYLTQGSTYASHIEKKHIPFPDPGNPAQPAVLQVELPATELNAGQDVTVIARVAEVWPSVLKNDPEKLGEIKGLLGAVSGAIGDLGQGLKAAWTASYPSGEEEGLGDDEPGN